MNKTDRPQSRRKEDVDKWKTDYDFKTITTAFGSLVVTIVFAFYNGFLGIRYSSLWYGGICVYYILLSVLRGLIILYERKSRTRANRKKIHLIASIVLLILNIALILPLAIMVVHQKPVNLSFVAAIAMAAYTTYKVIMASINLKRRKKTSNILVKLLRSISFIDALVSVITLQNTLIMVMSNGPDHSMFILAAITSGLIWLLILFITVYSSIRAFTSSADGNP